jgi:hypothetical protein
MVAASIQISARRKSKTAAHCSRTRQRPARAFGAWRFFFGLALLAFTVSLRAEPCSGPSLQFEALAPGLWLIPSQRGDANAANRGHVSNILLALDEKRVWLVGSGPTPTFARALACQVKQRFARRVTDVVSAWPRPEAVLGSSGLTGVRSWAQAEVAAAMRERCAHCVARLRERLGDAASDLGTDPVRVPDHLLHGTTGRLGPWRWWLSSRGKGYPVTVWQFGATPLRFAPGLLWGEGAPDGRDADIETIARSTRKLARLPARVKHAPGPAMHWLGEQGGVLGTDAPERAARYWEGVLAAVAQAQARGDLDAAAPPPLAALQRYADDPLHALNWQRAWLQSEQALLQRSLR